MEIVFEGKEKVTRFEHESKQCGGIIDESIVISAEVREVQNWKQFEPRVEMCPEIEVRGVNEKELSPMEIVDENEMDLSPDW